MFDTTVLLAIVLVVGFLGLVAIREGRFFSGKAGPMEIQVGEKKNAKPK